MFKKILAQAKKKKKMPTGIYCGRKTALYR